MRLLSRLIFIPVAAAAIVFAVANRRPVTIDLWPLPFAIDPPVYLAVLGALVIGVLIGGSVQWVSDTGWRRKARVGERTATALARELSSVQERSAQPGGQTPQALALPRLRLRMPGRRPRSPAR